MTTAKRRRVLTRRRPARGDPAPARERGMVTAELAAALPTLALVLIIAVWGISLASAQLRCVDAAREAARAAARGEDDATVRQIARTVAPPHADVDVIRTDGMITVEITAAVSAPPPVKSVFRPTVRGRATAMGERP